MTVPRSIFRLIPILLIVISSALAACVVAPVEAPVTGDGPAAESQPLRIVTSGSIVADWVHQIGGDHVEVSALVPPGGDMHMFQPGPQDVARVADADMVVMIGMGLEAGWLDQLFEQARADEAVVISLEEFIDPLPYLPMGGAGDAHGDEEEHEDDEDGHGHDEDADEHHEDAHGHDDDADEDHGHGHDEETDDDHGDHEDADGDHEDAHDHHEHGSEDPHFWFDPPRVRAAVTGLAQAMGAADPEHAAIYAERAASYGLELEELHSWIIEQVSVLSAEQRVLVTSHDSFQYFAHLYDFEVVGTIIPSLGTSAEIEAQALARLVDTIKDHGVNAIFTEALTDKLAASLAQETGVDIVVRLYTGSLGVPGSGAETYIDMMRHNVETMVQALSTQ
ncbi:MAG: metal ABC transporter substrate-binding protein [Caldilineaceae bacterium]|nr:metal ABC transporter substrate-binding protein [Caldilineaceae bacterium]MXZ23801.1 zinc ABC transporter substrate-binding protein [Caldilineaceae bacterium SB0665_bin_21]MYA04612.1 zinc ABC transporter substrate-binding protein [Caldilineaceae bacterium SB0664_bin_22]MYC62186.1 zinc ABC transporter substrate-binding protein [Caldilineaceae bacterium SB0661_bin_34]